jgi:membrane fusion protein (multidrug efflux system)
MTPENKTDGKTEQQKSNSGKRNRILAVAGTGAAIAILYFGYQYFTYVETDDAQIEAHTVMLAARVSGYIVKVNVVEGQKVSKDDVLVEIDSRDYENNLKQAKGDLSSVEARKRDAEKNFKRLSELYTKGVVSQQQFDASSASYSDFKAKYDAIAAQVSQAEINLENTKIKAPSKGVIAKSSVEEGQLAAPGVPLIGFVDSGERWVTANFKETDLKKIRPGNKAYIDVDAISGKDYEGTVQHISPATGATFTLLPPDNATGNFTKVVQRVPVRIKIENINDDDVEALRAGLSTVVKVRR